MIGSVRLLICCMLWSTIAYSDPKLNGFDLKSEVIESRAVLKIGSIGGEIPSLINPPAISAKHTDWSDGELIVGVYINDEQRAYPISLLMWHKVINDVVGGVPILVSFCPLCGTAVVYNREFHDGKALNFDDSGLLYRADVLLYDKQTKSLWSQFLNEAITGPSTGLALESIQSVTTPWGDWREIYPDTTVLSKNTGYSYNYQQTPSGDKAGSTALAAIPNHYNYHPKTPTLGLHSADGTARAYPAGELIDAGGTVTEDFAGDRVTVSFDWDRQKFKVAAGKTIAIFEDDWNTWTKRYRNYSRFVAPQLQAKK